MRRKRDKNHLNQTKNRAFTVFYEWGPLSGIPRERRLGEAFPEIDKSLVKEWTKEFEAVNDEVWQFAENIRKYPTKEPFYKEFRGEFPWMDETSLGASWSKLTYFAIQEGYDSK